MFKLEHFVNIRLPCTLRRLSPPHRHCSLPGLSVAFTTGYNKMQPFLKPLSEIFLTQIVCGTGTVAWLYLIIYTSSQASVLWYNFQLRV